MASITQPDYPSVGYQTGIEPSCTPDVRGLTGKRVIIKTVLIGGIMVAFSWCGYLFPLITSKGLITRPKQEGC